MEQRLGSFSDRMKKKNEKWFYFAIMRLSHPHINLSKVKLDWLPPNTSSHTQLMDQRMIFTFKSHYRRDLLQSLILKISSSKISNEVANASPVLDTVHWVSASERRNSSRNIDKIFFETRFPEFLHTTKNFRRSCWQFRYYCSFVAANEYPFFFTHVHTA